MGKRNLECPVCSISVERSWGYCPNCNYWLGDLSDSDSRNSDASYPSGGFSDVGGDYSSGGTQAADADKLGCTLGLFDEVDSGCGCAWATFVLVAIYTVAFFVLVALVSTTLGRILLGLAAVVAAVVVYRRWSSANP